MVTRCVLPRSLVRYGMSGLFSGSEAWRGGGQVRKLCVSAALGATASADSCWGSGCLHARCFRSRASGRDMLAVESCFQPFGPKKTKETASAKSNSYRRLTCEASGAGAEADHPSRTNCGGIHLIIGPMFAGKSTTLLRRVQEQAGRGRAVALVKSDKDTRYDLSAIVTHDGQQMPCYAVPDLASFKSKVGEKMYNELDIIGIDEAQFFKDLYEFCQFAADFEGKTLIVAGLDGDFLRRRFGSTLDLIPIADTVVKLSSRCGICGQSASFSFRKTLDIHAELVGGADIYMPTCRQHFVNGQVAVDTASRVVDAHEMVKMNKEL